MREGLEGETYAGRYVVADARLASPVAAGEGTVVVSPKGFVLLGIGNRANGSHHARPAYKRSRGRRESRSHRRLRRNSCRLGWGPSTG